MDNRDWHVRRLRTPGVIRALLAQDPQYAAFALGDLDPALFPKTLWGGAFLGGSLRSVALLYRGIEPQAGFTMGDVQGLAMILGTVVREPEVYFSARPQHLPALKAHYDLGKQLRMWRMVVSSSRFRPAPGAAERLTGKDLEELETLYRGGGIDFFSPHYLEEGIFYGVRVGAELVAAAGTHLVSLKERVAIVGNVLTRPDYRGKGLGTLATSWVTGDLLSMGLMVALNVEAGNGPAIRIYERLGYEKHCEFIEVLGRRSHQ